MKSRITKTVALAALMSGVGGVAHATEGWYVRADVGYSFDGELDVNGPGYNYDTPITFENDWSGFVGAGYAFGNGFRLEAELGDRFNQFKRSDNLDQGGDGHAYSAMANLFYDFNHAGSVQPYIGVGAGAAHINVRGFDHISPPRYFVGDDTVFAWQALAGIAIALTPQIDLDVGYRYFEADNASISDFPTYNSAPVSRDVDYKQQSITVCLRYQFAAPPPPPPPPAPPPPPPPPPPPVVACPTSDFVVYFEWDRSNLNQAALETIDAAVARARQCNVSGVVVVGHTDTSGSAQYNMGLSERRASVVRDALVARGIAAGSIQTQARGESDLARPTRDGVREPLNRRTAVTISFQ